MPYIEPEVIEQARQIDLLTYLRKFEPDNVEEVKGTRNVYRTVDHDSLKMSNGKWFWWSQGFGGYNALDYLIKVRNYSFMDAVEILTGKELANWTPPPKKEEKNEPKVLRLPEKYQDSKRVIQYLFNRGIDYQIIQECIADGVIFESNGRYHNAVFVGKDETGTPKYAAYRGLGSSTFKGDAYRQGKGRYSEIQGKTGGAVASKTGADGGSTKRRQSEYQGGGTAEEGSKRVCPFRREKDD